MRIVVQGRRKQPFMWTVVSIAEDDMQIVGGGKDFDIISDDETFGVGREVMK